jgi:hypothetical protein
VSFQLKQGNVSAYFVFLRVFSTEEQFSLSFLFRIIYLSIDRVGDSQRAVLLLTRPSLIVTLGHGVSSTKILSTPFVVLLLHDLPS